MGREVVVQEELTAHEVERKVVCCPTEKEENPLSRIGGNVYLIQ